MISRSFKVSPVEIVQGFVSPVLEKPVNDWVKARLNGARDYCFKETGHPIFTPPVKPTFCSNPLGFFEFSQVAMPIQYIRLNAGPDGSRHL